MAEQPESKFVLCENNSLQGATARIPRSALPWDGWDPVEDVPDGPTAGELPAPVILPEEPARNASAEDWRAYAVARGASGDDVADTSRTDLIATYATPED